MTTRAMIPLELPTEYSSLREALEISEKLRLEHHACPSHSRLLDRLSLRLTWLLLRKQELVPTSELGQMFALHHSLRRRLSVPQG